MRTVGTIEIAERIRRRGEPLDAAVNRVKSWLREGFFRDFLQDHEPGTGRARRYKVEALVDACLLDTLTQTLGAPATALQPYLKFLRYAFLASDPPAFLYVGFSPDRKEFTTWRGSGAELASRITESGREVFVVLDVKNLSKRFAIGD